MSAGTVAGVYAQALLGIAEERGSRAAVVETCRGLLGADGGAPVLSAPLVAQLDDPRLGKAKAKAVLAAALGSLCPRELVDLLALLIDRNRLADASAILTEAVRLANEADGRIPIAVVTATPLSTAAQSAVEAGVRAALGGAAELHVATAPELLGGMTIRVGDVFVDGSIRRKLTDMKARILGVQLSDTLWSEAESPRSPA